MKMFLYPLLSIVTLILLSCKEKSEVEEVQLDQPVLNLGLLDEEEAEGEDNLLLVTAKSETCPEPTIFKILLGEDIYIHESSMKSRGYVMSFFNIKSGKKVAGKYQINLDNVVKNRVRYHDKVVPLNTFKINTK